MKTFLMILIFSLNSIVLKSQITDSIQFKILNTTIKDGEMFELMIINQSNNKYYLVFDNSIISDICKLYYSSCDMKNIFLHQIITDSTVQGINRTYQYKTDAEEDDDILESIKFNNKCRENLSSKKSILLFKGKESKKILIKFTKNISTISFVDDTVYDEGTSLQIMYNYKDEKSLKKLLNEKYLRRIERRGFVLYQREIISNKIIIE